MTRVRPLAAIAALVSLTLAVVLALPARAATVSALSEDFEGSSLGALGKSDNPTIEFVADPADASNTVALITDRTQSWFSVQTPSALLTSGTAYDVSVRVRLADPGASATGVQLQDNSPAYALVASATVDGTAWTTLAATYTPGAAGISLYINAAAGVDLLVDDFVVTYDDGASGGDDACPALATVVSTAGFESGTDGWAGRGSASVAASTAQAHTGAQSLAVTGRTATWQGAQLSAGSLLTEGTYRVSGWVRLASGADPATVKLTVQASTTGDDTYTTVASADAVDGDAWVQLCGTYSIVEGETPALLYAEASDATVDFFLDDVTISTAGTTVEPCVPEPVTDLASDFEDGLGPWFGRSATVGISSDAHAGTGSVLVSDRTAGWHGAAVDVSAIMTSGTYTITAWVKLPTGASAPVGINIGVNQPGAGNEYPWVGDRLVTGPDSWVQLSGTYTVDDATPPAMVYLESASATQDFLVDDVTITHLSTCDGGPEPGTVAISTDFEDGLDGWGPRDNGTGAPVVAITTEDAHGGVQAALVSERTSQGSGIRFDVTEVLEPGATYEVTAWLKFAETPTEDIWMTLESRTGDTPSYATLAQFTGMSSTEWVQVTQQFTMPTAEEAYLYFETAYENGDTGNTSAFMIDDISVIVPEPPVVQDLTPIKDTVDFPVGVAIDNREVSGASSELLLKHFDQITPENYMKPEAWYDGEGNWAPNSAQIDPLMDFAAENDLALYGHVLVWHGQTPDWFFKDGDRDLTNSEADKQLLRDRMREHIFNVAEYLSDGWGAFGSDTNPLVAFDVVNEVIDDSAAYADGMRRSRWYQILGEEFVDDAFAYADEAFNDVYADEAATRPVTLFINDYNTEQAGKRGRYLALVDRLLERGAPVDGIGHQFHVSLAMPVENLAAAMDDASGRGLIQAVTEFDVTTGTPESEAKFIDQGYYYRDAFAIFRARSEELFSVTVWGLIDSRSWRDADGGPLVFDDGFQAKPAYYGIVEGESGEEPLPPRLRTANSFAGSVAIDSAAPSSPVWNRLPLLSLGAAGGFQTRWAPDHLTVFAEVNDATVQPTDGLQIQVGGTTYDAQRDGGGDVPVSVVEDGAGYRIVAQVPLSGATEGGTVQLDVRISDGGSVTGWNSTGVLGTVTLVEALSFVEIPEASSAPTIDGVTDAVWDDGAVVTAAKHVQGTDGALGTFTTLWKGGTLYVHGFIADAEIDVTGSDPWTQDSVEIYVDAGNVKNGSYRYDDTQIRINADNVVSFGTGDETFQDNRVESATQRVDGGYVVEAAISLLEYGGLGTFQGVDFQVNDAAAGSRHAIRNWADPTGAGYQSTARWGVAALVEGTGGSSGIPFPWPLDQVLDHAKGKAACPAQAMRGKPVVCYIGTEFGGQQVHGFIYSTPTSLGTPTVTGAGNVTLTIPASLPVGNHTIAIYAADGSLLGWAPVQVVTAAGELSGTGADVAQLVILTLALLAAGAALSTAGARRRQA